MIDARQYKKFYPRFVWILRYFSIYSSCYRSMLHLAKFGLTKCAVKENKTPAALLFLLSLCYLGNRMVHVRIGWIIPVININYLRVRTWVLQHPRLFQFLPCLLWMATRRAYLINLTELVWRLQLLTPLSTQYVFIYTYDTVIHSPHIIVSLD